MVPPAEGFETSQNNQFCFENLLVTVTDLLVIYDSWPGASADCIDDCKRLLHVWKLQD
jgi:hypothetical protein